LLGVYLLATWGTQVRSLKVPKLWTLGIVYNKII
jgi:hypothetical protein